MNSKEIASRLENITHELGDDPLQEYARELLGEYTYLCWHQPSVGGDVLLPWWEVPAEFKAQYINVGELVYNLAAGIEYNRGIEHYREYSE